MPLWAQILLAIMSPLFAAGGAYGAMRVTLAWHKESIDRAHKRLDDHDEKFDQLEWVRVQK